MRNIEDYIKNNDTENIKKIFDKGKIDCNIILSINQTPLIKSVVNNNYQLTLYFLKKDVFIDAQDKFGMSAIMYAAKNDYTTILKLLLFYNANPAIENNDKDNALDLAMKNNNIACIDLLSIPDRVAQEARQRNLRRLSSTPPPTLFLGVSNNNSQCKKIYNIIKNINNK